jgi:hypothetical protein
MPPRTLDLRPETDFHRRAWRLRRAAFALLGGVVVAALLGVFGGGPLSRARAGDGQGLDLAYERFARAEARTALELRFAAPAAGTASPGERELVLGRAWLDQMRDVEITPTPREVRAEAEAVRYRFALHGTGALHVRIEAEPTGPGRVALRAGQPGSPPMQAVQWVFP